MKFAFKHSGTGLFDRLITWWDRGSYSHVECILEENADGTYTIASSYPGKGVRTLTNQKLPESNWTIVSVNDGDLEKAKQWFKDHNGAAYFWFGILGFVIRPVVGGSRHKFFCSDACMLAAYDLSDSWRITPNCMFGIISKV